jgi:hypothetical protein
VRLDSEHIMPGAGCGPDLVELQQVRVDEHPQLRAVTEWWHAIDCTWGYAGVALGFGHNALKVTVADMSSIWKHR